jgi:hypothetical protein
MYMAGVVNALGMTTAEWAPVGTTELGYYGPNSARLTQNGVYNQVAAMW